MIEDTMREIVRKRIIGILEGKIGREVAEEIEKKLSYEERGRILKEYEKSGKLSEETYSFLLSKHYYKDLTSVLFAIPSPVQVCPKITGSLIGSGKSGVKGLRKHVRELGYSEDKFEEILQAIYAEIKKIAKNLEYLKLLAVASLEIGAFYLESDCEKAENFLSEAYTLKSELNAEKLKKLLDCFVSLAAFYCKIKKAEKTKLMYEKAVSLVKELGETFFDASTLKSLREIKEKFNAIS